MTLAWLSDRDDPRIRDALTRRCEICARRAGLCCVYPFGEGEPLDDRMVHWARLSPGWQDKP